MDHSKLQEKRRRYLAGRNCIPELAAESFEYAFEISYTHNSTAIEGNTLVLILLALSICRQSLRNVS